MENQLRTDLTDATKRGTTNSTWYDTASIEHVRRTRSTHTLQKPGETNERDVVVKDFKGRQIIELPKPDILDALEESQSNPNSVTQATLQREVRVQAKGSGARGRIRKDPKMSLADRNRKRDAQMQEDGLRPKVVSGRVSEEAHTALYGQKESAGEIMEIVGLALLNGLSFDAMRERLRA